MRKIRKLAFSGIMAVLLFVLSACQVDGVDLGKVLNPDPEITSSEGALTLNIEGTDNPAAPAQPGEPSLAALGKMTFKLTNIKHQDKEHASADGVFSYAKGDIAFHLYTENDQFVLSVDGAPQPIALNVPALLAREFEGEPMMSGFLGNMSMSEWSALLKQAASLAIKHYPNPSKLGVESVNESINNQTTALKKIHAEIKGSEVPTQLKQFLKNVASDETGLTELVKAVLKAGGESGTAAFDYSSLAVGYIQEAVNTLAGSMDESIGTGFFTDASWLKTDFYVDGSQHLRKIGFDANLKNTGDDTVPFGTLKLSGSYETWNLGQPVTAVKIDSKDAFDVTQPSPMARYVKSLDTGSKLYGFLVKDLRVTQQHIVMFVRDTEPSEKSPSPYIRSGNTLVPVRFVTERLDSEVTWNGDTKEVTVKSLWGGPKIVFTIGSKQVLVDGVPHTLEVEAELNNNVTYVPVRFISESFGATVDYKDGKITIDRP